MGASAAGWQAGSGWRAARCGDHNGAVSERIRIDSPGTQLAGERWPGNGPVAVLLHAGVADSRSWQQVAPLLTKTATVVAYDRRGFGRTAPPAGPFTHLDDLYRVLDQVADGPVVLVGSSAGGMLALDAAFATPERVAGLVLLAPAVSGAPEPIFDQATQRLSDLIDQATAARDLAEVNRLETWIWLDGPAGPEGRVSGDARRLALEMNAVCLGNAVPEGNGPSGLDVWANLETIRIPAIVACGDRDAPYLIGQSQQVAGRLPLGQYRTLPGLAHLPYLEQPGMVADLMAEALLHPRR
jgi:pimeloyl-ACP methyl ester carboxylesterase